MPPSFSDRLTRGVLLCDGAMGTLLNARGGHPFDYPMDALSLSHPAQVKGIHLDYLGAGAEVIQTNTFGANAVRLASFGLADRVEEINRAGAELAQEARRLTGQDVWVAGAMGPLGRSSISFNVLDSAMGHNAFAQQAAALTGAGVDLLVLETFPSLGEMELAVRAAQSATDLPIVAQMTFTEEGQTPAGDTPEEVVAALEELRVVAVGGNCGVGPEQLFQMMERMAKVAHIPLVAQPNAGFATYHGGRLVYTANPAYTAERARYMAEAGAVLLGGCCGTTPEHIAAIRDAVQGVKPPRVTRGRVSVRQRGERTAPPPSSRPTGLAERFERREFVVTVEVDPPRGFDIGPALDRLRGLAGIVHAVNVTDSPRAQGRMSALAACSLIQGRMGAETIMHMAIRHRNLLALHSDLLGAHALGVRNVFTVMGDVPHTGDYPQATAVADITSSGLVRLIDGFNHGVDAGGRPIDQPTSFLVGCALNLSAPDMDRELRVMERKVKAGAHFLMTQPAYDPEVVERIWLRLGGFPVPLLLGVLPLRSVRHAQFLDNEVPGISVPPHVVQRLKDAGSDAAETGLSISREVLQAVHSRIAGAYFIPPFERYQVVAETLAGVDIPGVKLQAQDYPAQRR
jgi:methionine synthase I (cobalamin-dependent)/5,10-methylenetetrahydrofolate reductase